MSDLLNSASLVVIPSGYKEDTVYSVVPSDGSGDLSFTRASNGTRVNSAGLVEVCPWNLLTYSQTFSNGAWIDASSGTVTRTSGFADPNGGNTAFKLVGNNASSWIANDIGAVQANNYTFSIWLKTDSTASVDLLMSYGTTDTSTKSITSTWQRYEFTASRSATVGLYGGINVGNGVNIYAWGAQLNIGSTAKPYFPTTDRLNVPRLTYQNGGGGCPSLLLEKQSTNYIVYSEDLTQSDWSKQNSTVTGNSTTSPDGTQNADKVIANTTNARHLIYQAIYAGVGTLTFTTYAKAGENSYLIMRLDTDSPEIKTWFNLSNGTIGTSQGGSPTITSVGNGWYRCSVTYSVTSGTTLYTVLYTAKTDGVEGFVGNNSDGTYMWGAQLEPSSYPTSLISTQASSATRVADACFKTGISSLIGQTEGVLFADFVFNGYMESIEEMSLSVNTSNRIGMYTFDGTNTLRGYIVASGAVPFENNFIALTLGQRYKVAFAYKSGDCVVYINGVNVFANSSTFSFGATMDAFKFSSSDNTSQFYKPINQAVLFKTRLTNAELASLTTI